MNILEIVKVILQYSGVSGVVLIFWHLDSARRDKQFNNMWEDHQALTKCVIESVNNNTRALEHLKSYIRVALGRDGIDGIDGMDGHDGIDGPEGQRGKAGKDGKDGKDA